MWADIETDYKYYCDLILADKFKLDLAWENFRKDGFVAKYYDEFRQTSPLSYNEVDYYFGVIKSRILNPKKIEEYDLFLKTKNDIFNSFKLELKNVDNFTTFIQNRINTGSKKIENQSSLDDLKSSISHILTFLPKYILCLEDIYNRYPEYLKD